MKSINIGFPISEVNCGVHVKATHRIREVVLFETWDKISNQLDAMSRWWLPEWKDQNFKYGTD